jgi:hypothetical protein
MESFRLILCIVLCIVGKKKIEIVVALYKKIQIHQVAVVAGNLELLPFP